MGRIGVSGRVVASVVGLVLAASGLGACQPIGDPAELAVTTTIDAPDAAPGDGICEATAGVGDCTLRAAVDEGNALGRADVAVPPGSYAGAITPLVVTGDLTWRASSGAPSIVHKVVVEPGARLEVDGLSTFGVPGARFEVRGSFVGRNLSLVGLETNGVLVVAPGGTATLVNSLVVRVFGVGAAVQNAGTLVLLDVALAAWVSGGATTTALANSGTVLAGSSILQTCSGVAPTSLGYNSSDDASCGLSLPTDLPSARPVLTVQTGPPATYDLAVDSPLVDAVPVGVLGCGTDVIDDLSHLPRPVDGDGDGVAACDIGARELPAPT